MEKPFCAPQWSALILIVAAPWDGNSKNHIQCFLKLSGCQMTAWKSCPYALRLVPVGYPFFSLDSGMSVLSCLSSRPVRTFHINFKLVPFHVTRVTTN